MTEVQSHRVGVDRASSGSDTRSGDSSSHSTAVSVVTVRYFAAARAASGVDEEALAVTAPATVGSALAAAIEAHGDELQRVLTRCSYLRNSVAVHGLSTSLHDGDALDVLPPFAGG